MPTVRVGVSQVLNTKQAMCIYTFFFSHMLVEKCPHMVTHTVNLCNQVKQANCNHGSICLTLPFKFTAPTDNFTASPLLQLRSPSPWWHTGVSFFFFRTLQTDSLACFSSSRVNQGRDIVPCLDSDAGP